MGIQIDDTHNTTGIHCRGMDSNGKSMDNVEAVLKDMQTQPRQKREETLSTDNGLIDTLTKYVPYT